MIKVVTRKATWTVGGAAFTRTNAATGAEHLVVDTQAVQTGLAIVGGGAASAQRAVTRGRGRFAESAVTDQAAVALAAVGTSAAASADTHKSGTTITVAGALWSDWCFAHAAVANFPVSAF